MLRRLSTLLSAVSLVLCVATCVLWSRSYAARDTIEFDREGGRWAIESADGRLVLSDAPQRKRDRAAAEAELRALRAEWTRAMDRLRALVETDRRDREPGSPAHMARSAEIDRLIAFFHQSTQKEGAARARLRALAGAAMNVRSMPHALPVVVFALPPLTWLAVQARAGRRHRRRRAANLCPACAYDLRATPGRCPDRV